nr:hypothetical protein Itr_chr04CG05300 [Ipomoea trifida]
MLDLRGEKNCNGLCKLGYSDKDWLIQPNDIRARETLSFCSSLAFTYSPYSACLLHRGADDSSSLEALSL